MKLRERICTHVPSESCLFLKDELSFYLLSTVKVALVTGTAFGAPDCIRISYAASENELIEAMDRLKKALDNLN